METKLRPVICMALTLLLAVGSAATLSESPWKILPDVPEEMKIRKLDTIDAGYNLPRWESFRERSAMRVVSSGAT